MLGDMASLSMMASQLALARKQRMAEKAQAEVTRIGRDRKGMFLHAAWPNSSR
jgi:signal transduction histidine kinase